MIRVISAGLLAAWLATLSAAPLETTFTYQGALEVDGNPATGLFDLEFVLFDAPEMGSPTGAPVLIEDVIVDQGIFSVELDFGAMPFIGEQRWLEISVRDGASAGNFTTLLPRQKLTATPYALHAEMVADDSIAGAEIADNSITAADIAANAVGTSEIANNSVGRDQIKEGQVQRRVSGSCAPGSQISAINQNGSVECDGTASYANVINVATAGADFASVTEAMDAIGVDPRYPASSDTNRYLIRVAPGVYLNEQVFMKDFVDIEGSGQGVTVLRSTGGAGALSSTASTLIGASNSEVRDIAIEIDASGAGLVVQAIFTTGATTLRNVIATARGGGQARAIVVRSGGTATLVDVIASVSGASDLSIGVDVEFGTIFADGLFTPVNGGVDVRGLRIHNASSRASLENVTTQLSSASLVSYGVDIRFGSVSIEGLRSFANSTGATTSYGVLCTGQTTELLLTDTQIFVETSGATGETTGLSIRSCNAEVYGLAVDATATTGTRVTGIQIFEAVTDNTSTVALTDVASRAVATAAPASALVLTNGGGDGTVFGLVQNAILSVSGGNPALDSHGVSHNVAGSVQYRGLTIKAGGTGNFVYGIQARQGVAQVEDISIDNRASAETTVFGIEFSADGSSVTNAAITAINSAAGSSHDAVGIKANNASGASFIDATVFADAETRAWGADLVNSQTRVVRVDARVGSSATGFAYGVQCVGGGLEMRDSVVNSSAAVAALAIGFRSSGCNGEVFDTDLVGEDIGVFVTQASGGGNTTTLRHSLIKGATNTIATDDHGVLHVVGSALDGGAAVSYVGSTTDTQECTAVTYNSGGSESFQAATSDPCP